MAERSASDWYRTFGAVDARGQSPTFEGWALGIADDREVLALIDALPLQKRQPNLVFACSRFLGAPETDYATFRAWLVGHWASVADEAAQRITQTNEPRRCAALLPALGLIAAQTGRPIALLELGASAGLCLYPDRYSYRYGHGHDHDDDDDGGCGDWLHPAGGPSNVRNEAETKGATPVPSTLPTIVWRAGIDVHPLDVANDADVRWLTTLVWPEQTERLQRVRAAIGIVQQDPPLLVAGNAIDELAALAALAPPSATLVIVSSAMLVYLPYLERMRLVTAIHELDARWVSLDGVGVLPDVDTKHPHPIHGHFTLSLDGSPLADVGPHGQFVDWLVHPAGRPQSSDGGNDL